MRRISWFQFRRCVPVGLAMMTLVVAGCSTGNNGSASSGPTSAPVVNAISPSEAGSHLGTNQTVAFHVGYTYVDSNGTEFLDQYVNYTSGFVVVIFSDVVAQFQNDPASTYSNQNVAVSGTIQTYGGYYEIVVNDPSQVQPFSGQLPTGNTGSTGSGTTGGTGTTGKPGQRETRRQRDTRTAGGTGTTNLPVAYRYATNTLNWAGFSISRATCL